MSDYDLLAEFGRSSGQIVYLARQRSGGGLVVARRPADASEAPLTITRTLDATVPADGAVCPSCMADLRSWGRFCPACGREIFALPVTAGTTPSPEQLLQAVRDGAEGRFDVLGSLARSEGGDTIYFAVDLNSADVVALRLLREGVEADGTLSYALEMPLVLSPVGVSPPRASSLTPPPAPSVGAVPQAGAVPSGGDSFTAIFARSAPASTPPPMPPAPGPTSFAPPPLPPPPVPISASATASFESPVQASPTPEPPAPEAPQRKTTPIPLQLTTPSQPFSPERSIPASPYPTHRSKVPWILVGVLVVIVIAVVLVRSALAPQPAAQVTLASPAPDTTTPPKLVATPKPVAAPKPVVAPTPVAAVAPAPPPPPASVKKPAAPVKPPKRVARADTAGLGAAITTCASASLNSDWTTAKPACERAAAASNADAELTLGDMYARGQGVPHNATTAFDWYKKAVAQNNTRAVNRLAWCYANGDGTKRDGASALTLFKRTADAGNADGEYGLGMMYANGTGTMRSDSAAVQWFRRSAGHGNRFARDELTRRGVQ